MSEPVQALPEDCFLVIHLPLVQEVLPMTATGGFVIRTVGLLAVGGRLEDAAYLRRRVIFLLFDDFRFDEIARRSPWHEYDAVLGPRESGSAVNQFFYFETHRAHDFGIGRVVAGFSPRSFPTS